MRYITRIVSYLFYRMEKFDNAIGGQKWVQNKMHLIGKQVDVAAAFG